MATIGVTSEDLHTQSVNVSKGAVDVDEILNRLTAEIANLAGSWRGGASDAFQAEWQEWQAGATQVKNAMESMANFLQRAAQEYENTEANITAAARG